MRTRNTHHPKVVIVGCGFAGLWAARHLAQAGGVDVTLIDRNNYHTFPPLMYQVAAAELEMESIAYPVRGIFRNQPNVSCVLAEARGLDPAKRLVLTDGPDFPYDYLILAAGSLTGFFGIPGAEERSFGLKSLEDAVRLRNHLLRCFERAALFSSERQDPEDPFLHVVVAGGGPTGVEYAGALAELIRKPLALDFPELAHGAMRVTLLDAADDVLPGFPDNLRRYARQRLENMGVRVLTGAKVKAVEDQVVLLEDGTRIPAATVVWTAGIRGHDVAAAMGLPLGRSGRVNVLPTLQAEGFPEIYAVGDIALVQGQNVPQVAPAAIQQGELAAANILRALKGEPLLPFAYRDKGSMATVGRNAAVTKLGGFGFSGFTAWVLWLLVHLSFLIGFRNRLMVMIGWAWDYLFAERAVRLIMPRRPPDGTGDGTGDDKRGC